MARRWILVAALLAAAAVHAAEPTALDAQVQRLAYELRCLVCQNQTIADSNADLAVDLRRQIREMLVAGKSEAEVLDFMTQRYGDFVLYRPPVDARTALLWGGPAAMLLAGAAALVLLLRRRSRLADDAFDPETEPDHAKPATDDRR